MIHFFRNIRRSLLAEGRIGKYIPYAIGEIFLVVVGILIAIQINNWNESRKQKIAEKEVLRDIVIGIEDNIGYLNFSINYNQTGIESGELILNHLDNNYPYHDSLDMHFSQAFGYSSPFIRNPGYESLKSFGMNIVEDDSILQRLIFFHSGWIETLVLRQEEYFANTVSPILTPLFETVAMRTEMKPFDYEEVRASKEFRSVLNSSIAHKKDLNKWAEISRQDIEDLKNYINGRIED
jgi:hypothetical protein